jgi:guanylate kinase
MKRLKVLDSDIEYIFEKDENTGLISVTKNDELFIKSFKRIILCGKMASGKDYLRECFVDNGFSKDISYTTRPIRANETNGVDYYFISIKEFEKKIKNNEMFEHTEFCGWFYGTTVKSWNNSDIFIFNPYGIKHIPEEDYNESLIIYLDVNLDVRYNRLKKREMGYDSVERRIYSDYQDFQDIKYHIKICDCKIEKL